MHKGIFPVMAAILFATHAWADNVSVTDASIHATAPGQNTAAVSLHIVSQKDGRLIAASSTVSARAELHTMKLEKGMMMMRQIEAIALPAKHDVSLGSGNHIMLIGLKSPLKAGDSVPLTLTIEYADKSRETIPVTAEVKPLGEGQNMQQMPGMNDMH